jgi:menaquinone-9 beta-reductase
LIPALPPRLLTALLAVIGNQRIVDKAFGWYLDQAAPEFAALTPRNEAAKVDQRNVVAEPSR